MKVKTGLLFFLFCMSNYLLAQSNESNTELLGNGATITTYSESQLSLNKSVLTGTWAENTTSLSHNLDIFVESDVLPTELGFYKGQSSFQFLSYNRFSIFQVSYDGGEWINLAQNSFFTGKYSPPWETIGLHTMSIRYWYVDGVTHNWSFNVYVCPPRDKIYYDLNGNYVSGWTGTTTAIDRPVVVVEGFDPVNTTFPNYYYGKASNFFNKIRSLDADVMIVNFTDGGRDIAQNAQIIKAFLRYIESIKQGNQKIILAGLSMGGVVARYALAEAEQENEPLNVSHFLSIDSPQKAALIPRDFQDYINTWDSGVPNPALNALAAKQMLIYDTYDPNRNNVNSDHNVFYNKLNSLNGNGYPHNCINVGVSFAPNKRNPNLGEWLTVEISNPISNKHFYLWEDNECKVAGSYLPTSSTIANGFSMGPSWKLTRHLDPTFIPYTSALDIVSGVSKFDKSINSSQFNYHDSFPNDIVNPIASEIGLLPDSYTNVVFKNIMISNSDDAGGSLIVTDNIGTQYPISSGDGVQLLTNQPHTVETLDRYRLNFSNAGINYQQKNWNKNQDEFKTKKAFKGWENNGLQEANFSKIDKISIKNNIENILSSEDIDFKDPWYKIGDSQPNSFYSLSSPFTPGDGNYISYGGIFLNLNPDPYDPNNLYYSIRAKQTKTILINGINRTFYFQNWTTNTPTSAVLQNSNALETSVVFKEPNATVSANYKGHLLSNNSASFSTIGQRKIVAEPFTSNRYLVYESQGYIWYSRSTDCGVNWSPEIKMSENGAQAKGASIAVSNGYTYILYQSDHDTYNHNLPTLILRKVSSNGSVLGKREVYPLGNPSAYSYNTMAVLTAYLNHILVVFKPNAATGLLGREFHDDNYKFASCPFNVLIFSETTQYSVNPSIAVKYVLPNRRYMLAYQESYGTIYCKEWDIATDLNNLTTTNLTSGSPYFLNRYPSIVSFGTGAKVCWIGGSASQYSAAVIRDVDPGSTQFWSFGFYASSPSITATDNNSAYFLGWKENGTGFKIVDNHLSNTYMKTLTGLQGNAIQLSSGINADVMYAMTYNNTAPPFYTLTPSKSLGYYYRVQASLSKENAISNIASGRAGVVIKDAAQFFFMLGDIEVNGVKIRFKELSDSLKIPSIDVFNTLVESESFELKENSDFTYSVEYGVTDSSLAAQVLQNDEHVKFKVEVVDASSGQIVGTLDPVSYTRNFLQSYSSIDYQVSTEAIRTMNVKLRLIVDHSGNASYSITNRFYDEDITLAKKGAKVINLNEDLQIKEYALAQNYPNPFNPVTTINYQLPKSGNVTLKIFDILGSEVKTLVNEQKEMGRYTVQFDASSLASGMYVYQLRANDYTSTKKMMLLK